VGDAEPTVLSSTDAVEVIAARLGDAAPPTGVKTKVLAIDGFGGAGKTTLRGLP
jgi:tRNA A37 threonylcarbamoyladenosine biosynthesis protein TsaE